MYSLGEQVEVYLDNCWKPAIIIHVTDQTICAQFDVKLTVAPYARSHVKPSVTAKNYRWFDLTSERIRKLG